METNFTAKDLPNSFNVQKKDSHGNFWIILVCALFLAFLVFSKWEKISNFLGVSGEQAQVESGFTVGEEISVEGILTQDGDFVTHTHKLTTLSSGVFGLKSKTINLNQYSGTVVVEGIVDSKHEDLYIIEVTNVISQFSDAGTGDVATGVAQQVGVYLPGMGLYLSPGFFQEYTIVSSGGSVLELKSLTSPNSLKIEYFSCKKGDPNKDCQQLSKTFSDSNEKTFSNQYGVTFYKLPEVNSWFFADQQLYGYFVNGVAEQDLTKLSSYIQLANDWYVENTLKPAISSLCKQGNVAMTQVTKTKLFLDAGKPTATFDGTWDKGTVSCTVTLDMSSSLYGTIKSFTFKEESLTGTVQTGASSAPSVLTPSKTPVAVDPSVKQFPINLEKALTFKSGRGHTISFPSPKISYTTSNVSENLGLAGVSCYASTRIVEYAKKDVVDSQPSVVVYECKIKAGVTLPSEYYQKPLSDGRTFVISVLDPAWHDFANNIQVTLNQ